MDLAQIILVILVGYKSALDVFNNFTIWRSLNLESEAGDEMREVHLSSYEKTESLVWLFVPTILDKVLCKTQPKLASFLQGAKSSTQWRERSDENT